MTIVKPSSLKLASIVWVTLTLSACGASGAKYSPIVDGPTGGAFTSDLADCRSLSETRPYLNDDVKSEAAAGAVVGAVIGALDESDSLEGAIAGAIVGGAVSAGGRAWETREERKEIIISCMGQRGHRVVG